MVSFNCDGCGDVVKKPKLDQHYQRCGAAVTCLDCSTQFNSPSEWKSHTTCISEAEKYERSVYRGNGKAGKANGQAKKDQVRPVNGSNGTTASVLEIAPGQNGIDSAQLGKSDDLQEGKKDKKRKKEVVKEAKVDVSEDDLAPKEEKARKGKKSKGDDTGTDKQETRVEMPFEAKGEEVTEKKKKKEKKAKGINGVDVGAIPEKVTEDDTIAKKEKKKGKEKKVPKEGKVTKVNEKGEDVKKLKKSSKTKEGTNDDEKVGGEATKEESTKKESGKKEPGKKEKKGEAKVKVSSNVFTKKDSQKDKLSKKAKTEKSGRPPHKKAKLEGDASADTEQSKKDKKATSDKNDEEKKKKRKAEAGGEEAKEKKIKKAKVSGLGPGPDEYPRALQLILEISRQPSKDKDTIDTLSA